MAATIPFALIFPTHLLDIMDDAWLGEGLPDDDVPLPPGVAPPSDDPDELGLVPGGAVGGGGGGNGLGGGEPGAAEARWGELGLAELQ
jgi:hypothetical protein